jgi:hypothetical protein
MRKAARFKFLSSIFFLSTFGSCLPEKEPDPKIVTSNDKCYFAVQNMLTFLNENLGSNNLKNLHSLKFAELFIDAISARSALETDRNSIDRNLSRLFETQSRDSFDLIEDLKTISEEIKKGSTAPFAVMGNSSDCREHFSKLGKSFESRGIEYVLIAFSGTNAKFFFSDYSSANNCFVDESGKIFDGKNCLDEIKKLGNDVQCVAAPIIRLRLKKESCFVHLGGFNWKNPYALPMFFSLAGALAYDLKEGNIRKLEEQKNKKQSKTKEIENKENLRCRVFLYLNSKENIGSNFLQSSDSQLLGAMAKIKNVFLESGINYVNIGNEKIVFSSTPIQGEVLISKQGQVKCNTILDNCVKKNNPGNAQDDIISNIFTKFEQSNAQKNNLLEELKNIENEINVLSVEVSNLEGEIKALEKQILQISPHKGQTRGDTNEQMEEVEKLGNDLNSKTIELNRRKTELNDKKKSLQEIQDKLKTILRFEESSLHITRLFLGNGDQQIEYQSAEGGKYVLDVKGLGDTTPFCQYFHGGELKDY